MSLPQTRARFRQLLDSVGRATLHSIFPDDFEYYACALELVDSKGSVVESLIFPVMPNEMEESKVPIVNIRKASAGVVSLYNPTFVPFEMRISGNFGRRLRLLINDKSVVLSSIATSLVKTGSVGDHEPPQFSVKVKNGYGTVRIMEKIYKKSFSLDTYGKSHRLFFYNLAFNSSYLIEIMNFKAFQNEQQNMIWNYVIGMKAIAPAYAVRENNKGALANVLIFDNVSKAANTLANAFATEFRNRANRLFE